MNQFKEPSMTINFIQGVNRSMILYSQTWFMTNYTQAWKALLSLRHMWMDDQTCSAMTVPGHLLHCV